MQVPLESVVRAAADALASLRPGVAPPALAAPAQLDEAQGRFLGGLAHEVRNHLNEISLASNLSRSSFESGRVTRANAELDRIDERLRDVAELMDELVETIGGQLNASGLPRPTSTDELLRPALERARRHAEARGLLFSSAAPQDARIEVDPAKGRRLLAHLLSGPVEAGKGGTLEARADLQSDAGAGRVLFVIEITRRSAEGPAAHVPDHGGEPAAVVSPTAARLARCLGATIEARAFDGGSGTIHRVVIPARRVASSIEETEPETFGGGRVLVVEDDRDARSALCLLLEDWGFDVVESSCEKEAVAATAKTPVRVALLDIELPGSDGFSVRDSLRTRDPSLPVLFLSGSERHLEAEDPDGLTRYLLKPVDLAHLEECLRELLATRPRESAAAHGGPFAGARALEAG